MKDSKLRKLGFIKFDKSKIETMHTYFVNDCHPRKISEVIILKNGSIACVFEDDGHIAYVSDIYLWMKCT